MLAFAATLAVITYTDRVCVSRTKGSIAADVGLSSVPMGYVFAAFTIAYALFEIRCGGLASEFVLCLNSTLPGRNISPSLPGLSLTSAPTDKPN